MTPRDLVLQHLEGRLAGVRWDHPRRDEFVRAALDDVAARADRVRLAAAVGSALPILPAVARRRLRTRTPLSVRAAEYAGALTPRATERLVREAWKRANPRWKLP